MSDAPMFPSLATTTFSSLSDDCLLCIIDELKKVYHRKFDWPKVSPIKALSEVNRRLRQLCTPVIFNLQHLTIKLQDRDHVLPEALQTLRQSFAASILIAFSVQHFEWKVDQQQTISGHGSIPTLAQQLVRTLSSLANLRELQLINIKTLDRDAKAALRQTTFDHIETLSVDRVPDAELFIRACPNLTTFVSNFPCNRPKSTFKALSESLVNKVDLDNEKAWKPKQLEELCQYLGGVTHLCLHGKIKAKATELMPSLRPLQNLRTLTIDTEPWVNTAPFSRIWSPGDRFADAVGDARAVSEFNQKPATVARSMFSIFPSLTTAWVIATFDEASQYRVERNADQSVNRLVPEQLRESGSEFSFEFSPFSTLFPKRQSRW